MGRLTEGKTRSGRLVIKKETGPWLASLGVEAITRASLGGLFGASHDGRFWAIDRVQLSTDAASRPPQANHGPPWR